MVQCPAKKKSLVLLMTLAILAGCSQPGIPVTKVPATIPVNAPGEIAVEDMCAYECEVVRVIDGDTLVVKFKVWTDITLTKYIRLAGIDTWEMRGEQREKGLAAKAFLEDLLKKGTVILHTDGQTGKYGRTIGAIYVKFDNTVLSAAAQLIQNGHEKMPIGD